MNKNKYSFILVLVIVVILWGDEAWISWQFHQLCKDAGVHVYQKVEVEGYLHDTHRATTNFAYETIFSNPKMIEEFKKDGFRFKERMFKDGSVSHLELVDGGIKRTILEQPEARYIYKYSANNKDMGLQLAKQEWVIIDSDTGEVLGRDTTFKRYPGWVSGLWKRLWGVYPTICRGPLNEPDKQKRYGQIYKYVLAPKNNLGD